MILNTLIISLAFGLAADKELDKFQGTWQAEKIVGRGKEITGERAKVIVYEFEGDSAKRVVNGVDRKDPATIKVDGSKKPAQIDLDTGKKGDPIMLGIYEIDGETLKWCFSAKKRPEKFESNEGSDNVLLILKRLKK